MKVNRCYLWVVLTKPFSIFGLISLKPFLTNARNHFYDGRSFSSDYKDLLQSFVSFCWRMCDFQTFSRDDCFVDGKANESGVFVASSIIARRSQLTSIWKCELKSRFAVTAVKQRIWSKFRYQLWDSYVNTVYFKKNSSVKMTK